MVLVQRVTFYGTGDVPLRQNEDYWLAFRLVGAGVPVSYVISDHDGIQWEAGIGQFTAGRAIFQRLTVTRSSNANLLVGFENRLRSISIGGMDGARYPGTVITADPAGGVNDWSPPGYNGRTDRIRVIPSASSRITGLTGGVDGRIVTLFNCGGAFRFEIAHEDVLSIAANRFVHSLVSDRFNLNASVTVCYDGTSSRWRPITTTNV